MMLLYFIVYLSMGWIIAIGIGISTVSRVYKKGYDMDEFMQFVYDELDYNKTKTVIQTIYGSLIWPIRLFENRHMSKELINMYEKHLRESE